MQGQPRGRGSRGRARPSNQTPPSQPGSSQPSVVATPSGAWGAGNPLRAAAPPVQEAKAAPVASSPSTSSAGRGQIATGATPKKGTDTGVHAGRAAFRGKRVIPENIISKLPVGKQGISGKKVILQTNYFRLEKRPDWCIFQYRVDFAPDIDVTIIKKKLFWTAIQNLDMVAKHGLFDGTLFYAPYRIHPDPKEIVVDSLNGDEKVRITIRMVGEIDRSGANLIAICNLIVRNCMARLNLKLIGRDYFDPNEKEFIAALKMELWPGYLSSIRQHERDILMCIEPKSRVVRTLTAFDVMLEEKNDTRSSSSWKTRFTERLLDSVVITNYNHKTYHIDDVDFDSSPATTFQLKDGSHISFEQYYKIHYGIAIKCMKQPLLVSKAKARDIRAGGAEIIKLIPELCNLTDLTEKERNDRSMMSKIAHILRPTPSGRIDKLNKFNKRLQTNPECVKELKQWDLTLSKDIVSLTGRKLDVEFLLCGKGGQYSATLGADWSKNLRSQPVFRNGDLSCWAIVYHPSDKSGVNTFYDHMVNASKGMSLKMAKPILKEMRGFDNRAYMNAIDELYSSNDKIRLYFVVIGSSDDKYHLIKKKLTVDKGVSSQIVKKKTLIHRNAFSIATNLISQMNNKVGGAPWSIKIPVSNWMICGFDVCHSKNKGQSYGAFVASYDKDASCYFSMVINHKDGEELSNFLGYAFSMAINFYAKTRGGQIPDKILFYRDGVGDGQLTYVYEHELRLIIEQLDIIYKAHNKPVALREIVVNKRINTRFFENGGNPGPGTVVDDVVTQPNRTDFFLIPQCTRQGTVSPTYYNVLGPDNFGLDMDKTQIITNRLCHQYYNWSGTVRVPAPCQYAHKLAFLTAQSLQRPPHQNLNHLLHFL